MLSHTPHLTISHPRIVLPICLLSAQAFCKPSNVWIDTAQTILENPGHGAQLETKSPQLIREALQQQPQSLQWEILLKTLPLRMQLDVLYRLSANPSPTKNDWQNLYKKVSYDLRTSWHYRLVVSIAFLLSIAALFGAFENFIRSSDFVFLHTSILYSLFIVLVFWLILSRGTEQPLEPNLFISLGLKGPVTFYREYRRLLKNQIIWNGTQAIFDTITNNKNSIFAFASAFTGAVVNTIVGAVTFASIPPINSTQDITAAGVVAIAIPFAITFAGVVAIASAIADAVSNDGTVTGTVAIAGAFTGAIAVVGTVAFAGVVAFAGTVMGITSINSAVATAIVVAGAVSGAFTFIGVGAFAGAGIGYWVRQTTSQRFSRYLAILAAPFFFGSPVVVWFSTLFLHRVAGFSWPIVGLFWLGIVTTCTLLFRRGRQLERLARNPLKGILPDYDTAAQ